MWEMPNCGKFYRFCQKTDVFTEKNLADFSLFWLFGRGDWIRTSDLLLPKQAVYLIGGAAPVPPKSCDAQPGKAGRRAQNIDANLRGLSG